MKKIITLSLFSLLYASNLFAQDIDIDRQQSTPFYDQKGRTSVGIGIGLAYGGIIGGNVTYNIADKSEAFLGLGYMLAGIGFNAGLNYNFISTKDFSMFIGAMYGVNASTYDFNEDANRQLFLGASITAGIKVKINSVQYVRAGLSLPFQRKAYKDLNEQLNNDPMATTINNPAQWITVAYHFSF